MDKLLEQAQDFISEFQTASVKGHANDSNKKIPRSQVKWSPPAGSHYKANYDGAVFRETGEASLGVVIRNSKKIPLPYSIKLVEALAAHQAVQLAWEIGLHSVELEGDSKVIFKALVNTEDNFGPFGHIIEDTKLLLRPFSTVSKREK